MRLLFIAILTTTTLSTHSQNYLPEFDRYNSVYDFDWRGFESVDSYDIKQSFVEFINQNTELLNSELVMLKSMDKELRFEIKAVDINNDKLVDIIYQGPWGGEGSIVHFFIRTPEGFEKVFTTRQGIVKVEWKEEFLNKIFVRDWGCCADPTLTNSVFQISYQNKIPTFELVWQSIELEEFLTKPKNYFPEPQRFEIENEKYKLRANPWIDDETENYHLEITGNTIGILKKGYMGTAYASREDETGRTWWYVIIDSQHELEDAYINYPYYEFKPHLVGWISSRYIKKL